MQVSSESAKAGSHTEHSRKRRGNALTVMIILIIVGGAVLLGVGLLVGLFVPALGKAREQGNRIKCAANLRAIAQHAFIYSNSDIRSIGKFPRTYYNADSPLDKTLSTGAKQAHSFDAANPGIVGVNNVPASFYLLMKNTDLTSEVFTCPSTSVTRAYQGQDIQSFSNWPQPYAQFNSYSYNCPFPSESAVKKGWKFDNSLGPDFPLASDLNPGKGMAMANGDGTTDVTAVSFTDGRKAMAKGNSNNHNNEGQQVAYCDVHVEWQTSPFAGYKRDDRNYRDNIFTSGVGSSTTGSGSTSWEMPVDPGDAVLLPTAANSPSVNIASVDTSSDRMYGLLVVPGLGLLMVIGGVIWLVVRRKNAPAAAGMPYGAYPPGTYPPGTYSAGTYPPGAYPPGNYPQSGGYPPPPSSYPPPPNQPPYPPQR